MSILSYGFILEYVLSPIQNTKPFCRQDSFHEEIKYNTEKESQGEIYGSTFS